MTKFGMRMGCWVAAAALGCGMSGVAQTKSGPSIATEAVIPPAMVYDSLLKGFEDEMMGVAKAMPADKYGFAPSAAIFKETQTTSYEGVRGFGAMIGHIAQANYYYFGAAGGMKPTVDVKAIGSMTSKEDLVAALQASFAFGHEAMAKITAENAFVKVPGPGGMQTHATMAGGGIAHGFDHYGQLAEYLRMNGIVPPASVPAAK